MIDRELIAAAAGRIPADLVLKNCRVADVFTGKVIAGDIAIKNGKITGVGRYSGAAERDMGGRYVLPGFIDAHAHVESTMITPREYVRRVLAYGVTTVIADPHEIANVCGEAGVDYMVADAAGSGGVLRFMAPSCVPATPFEHAGAELGSAEVRRMLSSGKLLGLGEMMNYPGVIAADPEVLAKLEAAGSVIDGHAPLVSGNDLNAYAAAGVRTDHECTNIDEMLEKISKGMYIQIREGSLSKDFDTLIGGVDEYTWRSCLFCSDDRNIEDLIESGTVNRCLRKAVEYGIEPMRALAMATRNAAECYGLHDRGAIAPGYAADLVVCPDLTFAQIDEVYKDGVPAAEIFDRISRSGAADARAVRDTVKLPPLSAEMFAPAFTPDDKPVIGVMPDTILTKKLTQPEAAAYGSGKLSGLAVIERHGRAGGRIGTGKVAGYGITGGAIASTIGHDSHNVIVIGDNADDMLLAVRSLGTSGGIAVAAGGRLLQFLPLPVAGLMSDRTAEEVLRGHMLLAEAAAGLEIERGVDPFLTLAFLPLPVIPELRLTDSGLFDVLNFRFI